MKEITRIITAQITVISKMSDDEADLFISHKEDAKELLENSLKEECNADDVIVEIKDFVMDK